MTYIVPERNAVIIPNTRLGDTTPSDKEFSVFPYELDTFKMLLKHGIKLPGPIRTEYPFKSRFPSPMGHQVITADFLTQRKNAMVFNEIGTAKTLSVLWAADYLMKLGKIRNVLICSTLSTLQTVWGDEIFKSMGQHSYTILHGAKATRIRRLNQEHRFYIINHDGLKTLTHWDRSDPDRAIITGSMIADRDDIDLVIVDESSQFRNQSTGRYKALKAAVGDKMLWLMSGAPMPRSPTDIWAQARLVCPHMVDRSFVRFRDRVMRQIDQYHWIPKAGWEQIIYEMIKDYSIRFTRDQCLDLPPCVTELREVPMSKQQAKAYESMKKRFVLELREGLITAANEAVKINKLLQIACGAVYTADGEAVELDCKEKLKDLKVLIEESGKKVIIYTPYKHSLRMLYDSLSKDYSVRSISGDTPVSKRRDYFHDFQNGPLQVIVAHPKCMAHGIDLTSSHTVIWWSPTDDNEIYEQASLRITRPGQTCKQTIIQLACSQVEHKVYKRLQNKQNMQGLLMSMLT